MTSSSQERAKRSLTKLEDSPDRAVRESVAACRSVASAVASEKPSLLGEFKADLHRVLALWVSLLEGHPSTPPREPRTPSVSEGGA